MHEFDHLLMKHEKIKSKIQGVSNELIKNSQEKYQSQVDIHKLPKLMIRVSTPALSVKVPQGNKENIQKSYFSEPSQLE